MTVLYVTSDERGAGKTALCAALADAMKRRGKRAAVFKPLSEATGAELDPDVAIFSQLLGQPDMDWPYPALDGGLAPKLLKDIRAASKKLLEEHDLLLIEGSSRVSGEDSAQLVDALDAKVLVVARYRPGLKGSRLTSWRELHGERLLGFVINGLTSHQGAEAGARLLPSMSAEGLVSFGVIPEDRRLLAVSVGQLASDLKGRFITGKEFTGGLVEHFMVGGLGMDNGVDYFALRENKGSIIRGDRPDIQMAALQTPMLCMVLTQGIEPIEYITYEAELEEVPVIVVQTDTLTTMDLLNTVLDGARFDHPAKLERLSELLREHVDLEAIYAALGLDLAS